MSQFFTFWTSSGKHTINLHEVSCIDWTQEKTDGMVRVRMTCGTIVPVTGQDNFNKLDALVREYNPLVTVDGGIGLRP